MDSARAELEAATKVAVDSHIRQGLNAQLAEIERLRATAHTDFNSAPSGSRVVIGGRALSVAEAHGVVDQHFDAERDRITAGWMQQREQNLRNALAVADDITRRKASNEELSTRAAQDAMKRVVASTEDLADRERQDAAVNDPDPATRRDRMEEGRLHSRSLGDSR